MKFQNHLQVATVGVLFGTMTVLSSVLPRQTSASSAINASATASTGLSGNGSTSSSTTNVNTAAELNFNLSSGTNDNYFFRNDVTSAQVLLTSSNASIGYSRFLVALPAGNSGSLVYFVPLQSTGSSNGTSPALAVTLTKGSLGSTTDTGGRVGVAGELAFNANARFGVTIIGAIRAIRDYTEGDGTMHEIFNYTVSVATTSDIHLHRKNINGTKTYDLFLSARSGVSFSVTPSTNGTYTPPTIDIILSSSSSTGTVSFRSITDEATIGALSASDLFLKSAPEGSNNPSLDQALQGLANGKNDEGQKVSFLTYQTKFLAGGWRFLTYFGRDSMITLRLLMPLLTSEAIEDAFAAVLERTNTTGALCHEETIGDYASFININNNNSQLGDAPYYDYKMVDTDLLLLPTMSHYFLQLPQGKNRFKQFLSRKATLQNGTYAELLAKNINYDLERTAPFAADVKYSNLISLRPGEPIGNWRDSNEGLGYGTYPYDVNTALVPAALRAIEALANASIIDSSYSSKASSIAAVWETRASAFFVVSVDPANIDSRLKGFVRQANLSENLLWLANGTPFDGTPAVEFYALSLKADGSPVEVLNSDFGFNLLYANNVDGAFLTRIIQAFNPYPRGLLTNIGMLVANPAYDSNRTMIDVLDRGSYHGTVSWSFQSALLAAGLARQLTFCDSSTLSVDVVAKPSTPPAWCNDKAILSGLKQSQTNLWNSINGAKDEIFSEVWSYNYHNDTNSFSVTDLGSLSPSGTESDAVQLWSFGFLALIDPTANRKTSGADDAQCGNAFGLDQTSAETCPTVKMPALLRQ